MLEKSFIIAFIVFGLHYIMYTPGMILSFVADWFDKKAKQKNPASPTPHWIEKPLYSCPICMTPWWGSGIYCLFVGKSVSEWLICIFCAMGINSVVVFLRK